MSGTHLSKMSVDRSLKSRSKSGEAKRLVRGEVDSIDSFAIVISFDPVLGFKTWCVAKDEHHDNEVSGARVTVRKRKVVRGLKSRDNDLSMLIDLIDRGIDRSILNNASTKLIRRLSEVLAAKTLLSQPFLLIRDKQSRGGVKGNTLKSRKRSLT